MSDTLALQTSKIVASLKSKPELLHSVQRSIRDLRVCREWTRHESLKLARYTIEGERMVVVRPARSDEGGKWRALLSKIVMIRHPAIDSENGERAKSFDSEMEAKVWADQVLAESDFILM